MLIGISMLLLCFAFYLFSLSMSQFNSESFSKLKTALQSKTVRWALYMFVSGVLRVSTFTMEDATQAVTQLETILVAVWNLFDMYAAFRVAANRWNTKRIQVDGKWQSVSDTSDYSNPETDTGHSPDTYDGTAGSAADTADRSIFQRVVEPIPVQPRLGSAFSASARATRGNATLVQILDQKCAAKVPDLIALPVISQPASTTLTDEEAERVKMAREKADKAWEDFKAAAAQRKHAITPAIPGADEATI